MNSGTIRLCRTDAVKLIRDCLRQGRIRTTRHFREELAAEGLTVVDAFYVLQQGIVFNEPEHDIYFQQWRYRMEGTEPDGQYVSIIFTFDEPEEGVLITLFSDKSRHAEPRKARLATDDEEEL
jgi:hypothetical protein